jgi:hypothetical protein
MTKPTNYTAYIKELFENKKTGDTFAVNMFDLSIGIVRATISSNVQQDYRTRFYDGTLIVTIISNKR